MGAHEMGRRGWDIHGKRGQAGIQPAPSYDAHGQLGLLTRHPGLASAAQLMDVYVFGFQARERCLVPDRSR